MRRSKFDSYRGRKTFTDVLKIIAVVLAVLVGLVLAALWLGRDYVVDTPNGPRLELPFFQRSQKPDSADSTSADQSKPDQSQPDPQPEPTPEPEPEPAVMSAMELPVSVVLDQTIGSLLEQAGATALVLQMKDEQGKLGWVSEQPLALQLGLNPEGEGRNEALLALNQSEIYTIARLCCFRDNTIPYHQNKLALRASYGNWRDELGLRWMNPDNDQVQAYVAGLCGELAKLGFDEIVLECAAFPTQGKVESILKNGSYATGEFDQAMDAFLSQVQQQLEPYDTALSIQVQRNAVSGQTTDGGLGIAQLEKYAQRIWMPQDGQTPALQELLSIAGLPDVTQRLVEIVTQLEESPSIAQAKLLPDKTN